MLNKCIVYVYFLLIKDYVIDKIGNDVVGW